MRFTELEPFPVVPSVETLFEMRKAGYQATRMFSVNSQTGWLALSRPTIVASETSILCEQELARKGPKWRDKLYDIQSELSGKKYVLNLLIIVC